MSAIEKIKLLYIDDEQNNLISFKAAYRLDYNILSAQNTDDAYLHLQQHKDIRIILCDQRMPDKTGVEFFEECRMKYPDPVRMLITGYTDIEAVIDAVNRGHIFRYIKKPWTDTDVRVAIEEANKFYQASSMLATRNKELEAAYNELGRFAYSVTHDVRGPILSILGALDLVNEMNVSAEVQEILILMEDALKKLDEYIKKMHEYYKYKRGILQFGTIDFEKIINDCAALFKITGIRENINFISNVHKNGPFYSDEISLKMIMNNLLSNAYNYQRKNIKDKFVDVNVAINSKEAVITVKDNGIGIREDHIANIFTMFYRATTEETGSGLGLFNVKSAVNKLGGNIEVISAVNEGTTFKVTIPNKSDAA